MGSEETGNRLRKQVITPLSTQIISDPAPVRYSKEHKYRPAASPILTETLHDGRTRIRGAAPTATPQPFTKPVIRKKSKAKANRKAAKPRKATGKV